MPSLTDIYNTQPLYGTNMPSISPYAATNSSNTTASPTTPTGPPTGYGGTGGWYYTGAPDAPEDPTKWIPTDWQQPQSMGGFLGSGLDWHNDIAPGLTFVGGTLGAAALGGGLLGDTAGGAVGGTAEGGAAGGAAGGGVGAGAGAGAGAGVAAPTLAQVGTAASGAGAVSSALGGSQDTSPPLSATQDPLGSGGDPGNAVPGSGGSGGAPGGAGSALSRIIDGTATTADWTSVLGNAAGTGLGIAGSINQQHALQDLANRQMAMGAPYRDRLAALYNDPGSYLKSPEVTGAVQQGTDALARSLSVQGNPIGSGHALQELQNYSTNQQLNRLGDERSRLGALGGLASFNAAAPGTSTAAVNAGSNVYNAVGSGIASLTNPQPSLVDLYRSMRGLA